MQRYLPTDGIKQLYRATVSSNQGLTRPVDHRLQRSIAGVLIRVQTLAMAGDAVLVDDGEAKAAFACCHDQAVHWSKSVGQCTNSVLSLDMSSHVMGVS